MLLSSPVFGVSIFSFSKSKLYTPSISSNNIPSANTPSSLISIFTTCSDNLYPEGAP